MGWGSILDQFCDLSQFGHNLNPILSHFSPENLSSLFAIINFYDHFVADVADLPLTEIIRKSDGQD